MLKVTLIGASSLTKSNHCLKQLAQTMAEQLGKISPTEVFPENDPLSSNGTAIIALIEIISTNTSLLKFSTQDKIRAIATKVLKQFVKEYGLECKEFGALVNDQNYPRYVPAAITTATRRRENPIEGTS